MTLTILGATGKTGVHLLARALEAGHRVRVLVRDPAKLGRTDERLTVVQGDLRDAEAVARADLATFLLAQVDDRSHVRASPVVSN